MDDIRLARVFFLAERLGGVFYDRFSAKVENRDVGACFAEFAGEEHDHAEWYAGWLRARGHEPPNPAVYRAFVMPPVELFLYPQSLERKLVTFSRTESLAARHLTELAAKIRDPELASIVKKTIPFEEKHARWYDKDGRRMLRAQDR